MRVFITGISSGIGRELTALLVRDGHDVFGVARRAGRLEELRRELGTDRLHTAVCDVANPADVARIREELARAGFLPDVVVLNAAIEYEDVPTYRYDVARETFETNVLGALVWVECFFEPFLQRGSGQFIAVSSLVAFRPDPASISYSASKAALTMAFRGFRLRYRGSVVRFKTVYFGPVATLIKARFARGAAGSKPLFVISAKRAARAIRLAIRSRGRTFWVPRLPMMLFWLSRLLPDAVFLRLARVFRR